MLKIKNENSWKCIFKDFSEDQIKDAFIKPYKKGKNIIVNNEIISTKDISHVVISNTHMNHRDELKKVQKESYQKIQEMNRNSSVSIISAGDGWYDYEIKDCGKNVTSIYLNGGAGEIGIINIFNNPWIVTLIGGSLVAIFATLIA